MNLYCDEIGRTTGPEALTQHSQGSHYMLFVIYRTFVIRCMIFRYSYLNSLFICGISFFIFGIRNSYALFVIYMHYSKFFFK